MFNKKKPQRTQKEKEIIELITNLCKQSKADVRVDPINKEYFISLEDKHYDVIIDSVGIIITNSKFSLKERFSDEMLTELKMIAAKRASEDRQRIKTEILSRELKMLNEIKQNLED